MNIWHPCSGVNGKCVEKTPRPTKRAPCVGCERGYALLSESALEKREEKEQWKAGTIKMKQYLYYQLHEGLSSRPTHLQGITYAVSITIILGLDKEDFVAFYRLADNS
jgi:hypothetical protein